MYISYVGDVNGDNIDDFAVGYDPQFNPSNHSLTLYCGNDGYFDPLDRIVLYDATTEPYNDYLFAFGIGDFNGDGFDDYLSMYITEPMITLSTTVATWYVPPKRTAILQVCRESGVMWKAPISSQPSLFMSPMFSRMINSDEKGVPKEAIGMM